MKPIEELQPHQQRVVEEQKALAERIDKLKAFSVSPKWFDVPADEQDRMMRQLTHMSRYNEVLEERIAAF